MATQGTPNPDVQADPVSALTGSEDEAAAAFAAIDDGEEPSKDTDQTPADEPADDADPEAEQADPDEAEEADELVEVEIGGKTFKVAAEVEKAVLRQADYSRKMNEVGAKEKAYVERIAEAEKLVAGAEKRAEALATVRLYDAQIEQIETAYRKARAEGSADAPMLAADLLDLKDSRRDASQAAANVARELTESRNKLIGSQREAMDTALKKDLKGWGEELGTKITQYAVKSGYTVQDLQAITDPKWVVAMDKARKFDALQSAKTTLKAKASEAPPVVKPGTPRRADPKADVMARLRKENTQEAAEAAFLNRMR